MRLTARKICLATVANSTGGYYSASFASAFSTRFLYSSSLRCSSHVTFLPSSSKVTAMCSPSSCSPLRAGVWRPADKALRRPGERFVWSHPPYRCKFYPALRLNFAPQDAYATPCVLQVENAPALPLHLRKASRRKAPRFNGMCLKIA